jgi:hypothetical protein
MSRVQYTLSVPDHLNFTKADEKYKEKHGKIHGIRYDLNISFIFSTYSHCHR